MSPTRRVLVGIGGLLVAMLAVTLLRWHLQTRALSDALVADLQATQASRVALAPAAKFENGYACFAEVEKLTPKDLAPVDGKNTEALKAVLDAGVVPDAWQPKLEALAPWAESLRGCGDAAALEFVPGLTPFETKERGTELLLALGQLTRLQARQLAAKGEWVLIVERCASTLEVSLDRSQLNLVGAMVAGSVVRQLTPPCGEALLQVGPEARSRVAARFSALPQRLVTNHQLAERERQLVCLGVYGWLLPEDQRAKLPPSGHLLDLASATTRFTLRRLWNRHDRAMRALVVAANAPGPARQDAGRAVDEVFNGWWVPPELRGAANYEKFFRRNEDTMTLLRLLGHLAAPSEVALPADVSRTSEGYEVVTVDGAKVLVAAQQ